MANIWVYVCFFVSGFSGLVNEVVWSRLFVYTMGSSHLSIAVVVSTFMGGLALGSWVGGGLADRSRSPLRLYGWLVLLAGALSGAVLPLLWLLEPLLGSAYRLNDGQPNHVLFTLAKAAVCSATILLPTTFMGATLPALVRHTTRSLSEVGARIGALYAINTFGAVAGAAAAGFYLVARIGLGASAVLAALLDVAIGAAVLLVTRRAAAPAPIAAAAVSVPIPERGVGAPPAPSRGAGPSRGAVRIAVLAFGISGFVNMALQMGWTRSLIISIGNSTYAFTVIVGTFIFGLAAGGWIASLFADRVKNPFAAFGWVLLGTAAAAGATLPWLGMSPARFAFDLAERTRHGGFDFTGFLTAGLGGVALVVLPATILMGMGFPLVGRLRALSEAGVGRAVGVAYGANTIGAILGTALPSFVLMPLLGRLWKFLYLSVGLGLAAGVLVLLTAPGPRRGLRLAGMGAAVAALLALAYPTRPHGVFPRDGEERLSWHPAVFAMGAYRAFPMAREHRSAEAYARAMARTWEPLYYQDGEVASVAVLRHPQTGNIVLNIAGKVEASSSVGLTADLQTQLLSGHLPLILHPSPRRALCLGLGGGMTLGAMVAHPTVESIDLLELSPEVVEAARLHFAEANRAALVNPRVRTVIGDGRTHLTHTAMKYDVITSVPSNFWIAGVANLFTEEFYRLVMDRLDRDGILCQWIYGYNIRLHDYHIALRTILRVFPHVVVWTNHYADTLLLASREPIALDRERIARALGYPYVRADLEPIGVSEPEDLFRYFQAEGKAFQEWVGEGPINHDLFPILEFSSPLGYYDEDAEIPLKLASVAPAALPAALLHGFSAEQMQVVAARQRAGRAMTRFVRQAYDAELSRAVQEYSRLIKEGDDWSIESAARELTRRADPANPKHVALLQKARESKDTPDLCLAAGCRPLGTADLASQLAGFHREAGASKSWEWLIALALADLRGSRFTEAAAALELARRRGAPDYRCLFVEGLLQGMQGKLEAAEGLLLDSLGKTPSGRQAEKGETAYNLGYCLEQRAKPIEAARAYRQAMALGNDAVRGGLAAARCFRKGGDFPAAIAAASEAASAATQAVRDVTATRAELARAYAAAGRHAEALPWLESAAKASPGTYDQELAELRAKLGR